MTITAIIIALESRAELELTSLVRTHTDVSGFLYFKHEQSDKLLALANIIKSKGFDS